VPTLTRPVSAAFIFLIVAVSSPGFAEATPQFARKHRVDCSVCHSAPPRLNARGMRFVADGYRLARDGRRFPTVPVAVWNTTDLEWRQSVELLKGYAGRIELISAGPVGSRGAAYFIEWRALSQSLGGDGRLANRSGRFEDLFLRMPLSRGGAVSVTAGQFRTLAQVDVSLRLSLSEPLVFSSSVPGRPATTSRLTSLRGFSASGRQPGVRIEYLAAGESSADGWVAAATLPLTGELTIPLTDNASFELEGRPKGVFVELFRRRGLTSIGGHAFAGDADRRVVTGVVTHDVGGRLALLGGVGMFHAAGVTDTRFSVGAEATFSRHLVGGFRVDHRTGQGRDPVVFLYANGHLPFGPPAMRQALRLQVEQRLQSANHAMLFALSHVF
jgi:hypothetical protein